MHKKAVVQVMNLMHLEQLVLPEVEEDSKRKRRPLMNLPTERPSLVTQELIYSSTGEVSKTIIHSFNIVSLFFR